VPKLQDRHWGELKALLDASSLGERMTPENLKKAFNVSLATIYGDLELLSSLRIVRSRSGIDLHFEQNGLAPPRFAMDSAVKLAIAEDVVSNRIGAGQVVYLDTGSTCFYIARRIVDAARRDIRLVTANPFALGICVAADVPSEIIALGGTLRREAASLHGPITQHAVQQFAYDLAIISVDFVHGDGEVTIAAFSDAEVTQKQFAIAQATSVIVVAEASKLNRPLGHAIASLKTLSESKSVHVVVGSNAANPSEQQVAICVLQQSLGEKGVTVLNCRSDE
jgi:DeoR/GlpR family transcriptional regulator of sugar metabolism